MFTESDYVDLNTADTYFEHIEHSINAAIKSSAPLSILNPIDVYRLQFEIAIGMYCEVKNEYVLKIFNCIPIQIEDGKWDFQCNVSSVANNEIAVLGIQCYKNLAINALPYLIKIKNLFQIHILHY